MNTIICQSCNKKLDEDLSILGECHDCSIKGMNTPQGEGEELAVKKPLTTPEAIIRGQCLDLAVQIAPHMFEENEISAGLILAIAKYNHRIFHDWLRYE